MEIRRYSWRSQEKIHITFWSTKHAFRSGGANPLIKSSQEQSSCRIAERIKYLTFRTISIVSRNLSILLQLPLAPGFLWGSTERFKITNLNVTRRRDCGRQRSCDFQSIWQGWRRQAQYSGTAKCRKCDQIRHREEFLLECGKKWS